MQRSYALLRPTTLGLLVLGAVACGPVRTTESWPASADTAVVRLLERTLTTPTTFDQEYPGMWPVDEAIGNFYASNRFRPAWMDGEHPTPLALQLIEEIRGSVADGLDPRAFGLNGIETTLAAVRAPATANEVVRADLELTRAFMQFVNAQYSGAVDPRALVSEVYLAAPHLKPDSLLTAVLSTTVPGPIRDRVVPNTAEYSRLVEALATYRALAEAGGWEVIPPGQAVKPGETDTRLPALRRRLVVTGDLGSAEGDSLLDAGLMAALARFQARHGIDADSTLGDETLAALNVTVDRRIRQIELSLERWRWLPNDLGERYIFVNIPAYTVYGFAGGRQDLVMRVVVGAEYGGRRTPVFSDVMDHVIFHPYWNVPESIASSEMVPNVRRDASWLSRKGYEVINGSGNVVNASLVDPDGIDSGRLRIRQKPGPTNALGLVKFMFPNPHGIYLHDTPSDQFFVRSERGLSHGCIRLEDPPQFAEFVLGRQGWSRERILEALESKVQQTVPIDQPIPVYLMYMSAFVTPEGVISFRNDIYGNDEVLDQALTARAAGWPARTSP